MKYSNTTIRELTARYSRVLKKCALLNAVILLGVAFATPAMAATSPQIIVGVGDSQEVSGTHDSYETKADGSIILNSGTVTIADGSVFSNTGATNTAGAIKNSGSMIIGDNVQITNNSAPTSGAFENTGDDAKLVIGNNVQFTGNTVTQNMGGALANDGSGQITIGDDAKFISNHATGASGAGAAIYQYINQDNSDGSSFVKIGNNALFEGNTSTAKGALTNFDGIVEIGTNAKFSNNTSGTQGGAIANADFTYSQASMTIGSGATFTENKANQGGAIYNTGDMTIASGATFTGNEAVQGGAIYNKGTIDIVDATFSENKATGSGYGGAIFNGQGVLTVSNSNFSNNNATWDGAAISSATSYLSGKSLEETRAYWQSINGFDASNKVIINNSIFESNTVDSYSGGALGIYSDATITNSSFVNNNAGGNDPSTTVDGGGAIYVGGWGRVDIDGSRFDGNSTNIGGAIATTHAGIVDDAYVTVKNTEFTGNTATQKGGAIANGLYTFNVENSTFTNNSTNGTGGAIHNMERSTINLSGTNTFSGNMAAGQLNDIHNDGTLNIAGNLTLDGGITGTGDVVFDAGSSLTATLNTTTILANSVTTNGSNLNLLVANGTADGDYDFVTADSLDQAFKLGDNTLYDLTMGDDGKISVVKKSTDEVAGALTSAGAGTNEAAAIVAITNVETTGNAQVDAVLNQITTAAQTGDVETAAGIVKQINPTEAPVVQAVATNGAVLSAVTNRLAIVGTTTSAGAQGRSGGDVVVSKLSPWVQGLYNKTHNSQGIGFDAYSQGFAFGVDTDLNDDWTVGVGYAYTATDIKNSLRKTQVYGDNYFVYGQYKPSNWYVNGVINYGHSNYKDIGALTSHYDVDTYGAQVMTGYQWDILDNYAGVRYTYIDTDKYNNGLTEVDTKSSQIATAVIGTKVSKDFTPKQGVTLTPEFRLAATYDFKSDSSSATVGIVGSSASYTVEGERLHRAAVETGIGLTAKIKNLELSANYDASLRSENNTQAVNLKAIYHF